jgi:hypothetical protein
MKCANALTPLFFETIAPISNCAHQKAYPEEASGCGLKLYYFRSSPTWQ